MNRRTETRSRLRTLSSAALASLATVVSVGMFAGQAQAVGTTDTVTCATVTSAPAGGGDIKLAGTACFHSYGDYFMLTDERADGYHVEVWWRTDYDRVGECRNIAGAGETVKCDYDMKEGSTVTFNAMVVDNATTIMGGAVKHATV